MRLGSIGKLRVKTKRKNNGEGTSLERSVGTQQILQIIARFRSKQHRKISLLHLLAVSESVRIENTIGLARKAAN